MTGPGQTAGFRRDRIKKLTEEGRSAIVIAERLGLTRAVVYEAQVRYGFRTPIPRKRKENENSCSHKC